MLLRFVIFFSVTIVTDNTVNRFMSSCHFTSVYMQAMKYEVTFYKMNHCIVFYFTRIDSPTEDKYLLDLFRPFI